MKALLTTILLLAAAAAAVVLGTGFFKNPDSNGPLSATQTTGDSQKRTVKVERGPLHQWSVYDGRLEARKVQLVMSEFSGSAVVVALAAEGKKVQKGEMLVQFDTAKIESDLVRFERDFALAETDLESLDKAKLPLELRDLTFQLLEAAQAVQEADNQLSITRRLNQSQPDTISRRDVDEQQLIAAKLRSKMEGIEIQLELTKNFLHPGARARATATRDAARQALGTAREQLAKCTIRAPADGTVVYRPLHIGSEFRTVRVGDSIYKNQVFLSLPDLSDIVVQCHVPESELSLVERGVTAQVTPLAFRDLTLQGQVEKVGSMAQSRQGQAEWQKYFELQIAVEKPDPRLRSGMSVFAHVLSYQNDQALLLPRAAVRWDDDQAFVQRDGKAVAVRVGRADKARIEVLEGLAAGDEVELP